MAGPSIIDSSITFNYTVIVKNLIFLQSLYFNMDCNVARTPFCLIQSHPANSGFNFYLK